MSTQAGLHHRIGDDEEVSRLVDEFADLVAETDDTSASNLVTIMTMSRDHGLDLAAHAPQWDIPAISALAAYGVLSEPPQSH